MIKSLIAVCFAANMTGLPVNKCFIEEGEVFDNFSLCEAWAYSYEEDLIYKLQSKTTDAVVANIKCMKEKIKT
jgi:hypothetical protein